MVQTTNTPIETADHLYKCWKNVDRNFATLRHVQGC